MKKHITIIISIFLVVFLWNCEKDDICADGTVTTPQLVVEFYDATVTDSIVTVSSIGFREITKDSIYRKSSVSQLLLPLKTNEDSVTFELTLYGDDDTVTTDDFSDTFTLNYNRQDIYISRACGYKTNFTLTDAIVNSTNWITNATIEQPNVTNENEVHIKIYF
ncbi:DUF6452 family protein [Flavobacterium sp.]|uniref:DUF6452 family protein n=1 Tax=Flavobacterium sp. TaxID=239 RepID=UPI0035289D71